MEDGSRVEAFPCPLEYLLLDKGRIAGSELEPLQDLAAALFRLETSRAPRFGSLAEGAYERLSSFETLIEMMSPIPLA